MEGDWRGRGSQIDRSSGEEGVGGAINKRAGEGGGGNVKFVVLSPGY